MEQLALEDTINNLTSRIIDLILFYFNFRGGGRFLMLVPDMSDHSTLNLNMKVNPRSKIKNCL